MQVSAWRLALLAFAALLPAQGPLLPPPAPPQNPTTPAKALLGKALFWEEQLSSSGRVACGTCHRPERGGGDARRVRHPGLDGQFFTVDDTFGSPGIERRDANGRYVADPWFGDGERVTRRAAPGAFTAPWFDELFWDGRAHGVLVDPLTNAVVIPAGAALEHLALHPLRDEVEMSRAQRPWSEITQRLLAVRPLALATDLPSDLAAGLQAHGSYPGWFAHAFGDPAVTPVRIAMALASYLRSLVPNQTPWDLHVAGQAAMSAELQAGFQVFVNDAKCGDCHTPGLFSDRAYRALGLTPIAEDPGRGGVTGIAADLGRFKVPSLRNTALKSTLMHNGRFTSLVQVVNFYRLGGGSATPVDPLLQPFTLDATKTQQLMAFLDQGLVDPRLANALPPFDRPTLFGARQPVGANLYGAATPVSGVAPRLLAQAPIYSGNAEWLLGIADGPALGPAVLLLGIAPGAGQVWNGTLLHVGQPWFLLVPLALDAAGRGDWLLPIPWLAELRGLTLHSQTVVASGAGTFGGTTGATLVVH